MGWERHLEPSSLNQKRPVLKWLAFNQLHLNRSYLTIPSEAQFNFLSRLKRAQDICVRCQVTDWLSGELNQDIARL